jgi:hypothetical protein
MQGLVRTGAIALIVAGAAYLVITVTGAMIGVSPGDDPRWLDALAARPSLALETYGVLTAVADLALVPAALALYVVLAPVRRGAMLLASAILLVYVAIDMSTFVPTAIALTRLAGAQAATTDATQRAALGAAMAYGAATIPFSQFFGWFFPPLAFLLLSWTLRSGHIAAKTALLGILTAAFSMAGSLSFIWPGGYWDQFLAPGLFLFGMFQVVVGLWLLRLDRQSVKVTRAASVLPMPHPLG